MQKYRGYYIDKVVFNSKEEIDKCIEDSAVLRFKNMIQYFAEHPSLAASKISMDQAQYLHDVIGYSWERIEQLEIEAYKELSAK